MAVEIVQVHGTYFTRFLPDEPIEASEAHCIAQTCGTVEMVPIPDPEYPPIDPEAVTGSEEARAWWSSTAGKMERKRRREAKEERERAYRRFLNHEQEVLNARKRLWAEDAMRCGLPNPYPEAFGK